ncbi:hypothetical protein QT972_13870 [Microcoleus sp. herbarium7]|uniref:hypothetical protein n=1 Tax=Microcoleus sp. herbarium7 TaxID=3055435 RepID=UPI002FD34691
MKPRLHKRKCDRIIILDNTATLDTAMPFFAPQNNQYDSIKDATIARLTVGKPHCRLLTFDATIARLTVGKRHCRLLTAGKLLCIYTECQKTV